MGTAGWAEELRYVPYSTQRIGQLTGDFDRASGVPTLSQTDSRFGLSGTDLGSSFEHNGKLYFLFGDSFGRPGARDVLAWTTSTDPERIMLDLYKASDGKWLPLTVPGISQADFEVPSGGISIGGVIYVVCTTDHSSTKVMGRSVLASSHDDGRTFQLLYELSRDKFINVSFWSADGWVYIYGSGDYRKSSVCLARVKPEEIADRSRLRFFTGIGGDGLPRWSAAEADAVTLFHQDQVGEFSVAYLQPVQRYVMLYNAASPRGITMRSASAPWGPWSDGTVIFEPTRDHGYGEFMHAPGTNPAWHAPFPITPPGAAGSGSALTAVTRFEGALDTFWLGPDRAIGTTWANPAVDQGRWHSPFPIAPPGAAGAGSSLAAVARFVGALDAFWLGEDRAVGTTWANPNLDGGHWHTPFAIAPPAAARSGSPLAVVTRLAGALDAFWIGPDGAIGTTWANPTIDQARWHTPFPITSAGAARSNSPLSVVTRFDGALDAFWIGSDGAIATNWANPDIDGARWHASFPITPPGAARPDAPLAVVTRLQGALDAFWIGPDGAIATTWANPNVDGARWHAPFPITPPGAARPGSPLAVVTRLEGALDAFWIGADGAIGTTWANPNIDGARWHPPFPITPPGAARSDSPLAVVTRLQGGLDVFWIGPDGAVATTWANPNATDGLSDPGREGEWGGEYGPYLMARFTRATDSGCRIYYTMSTWNPYQVMIMRSDLSLAGQ
jgi:hypothetical protein